MSNNSTERGKKNQFVIFVARFAIYECIHSKIGNNERVKPVKYIQSKNLWHKKLSLLTAWIVFVFGVFSGPYFSALGLNTDKHFVFLRIQSKFGKIRTRKAPHTCWLILQKSFIIDSWLSLYYVSGYSLF